VEAVDVLGTVALREIALAPVEVERLEGSVRGHRREIGERRVTDVYRGTNLGFFFAHESFLRIA
jgi:hypothetical protein